MKALIFILCLGLILAACKKNDNGFNYSQGTITGYENGSCPTLACSGLEIKIENDPSANPPPFYRINSTLSQLNINDTTKYPINVSLNWKRDTGILGTYNFITVSRLKVIR